MGYLRHNQIEELENEKNVILRTLQGREVQDRGALNLTVGKIDRQLEEQAPPELTGEDRDRLTRENSEIEARLIPLMPSDTEMRRNPPGVIGRHKRFDKASKDRTHFPEGDIFRWKDNRLALHKGDDDPDVANFELMRPLDNMGPMAGAQIPGQQFFGTSPSPAYLEGYDRTFGKDAEEAEEAETIVDPPKKVVRKKKATPKRSFGAKPQKMTELACGRMMGTSGRHFHIKKCEVCTEAAAKE
jgi:hypothetical protein